VIPKGRAVPARPPPLSANRIGTVLSGRYRLTALIGEGGMGAVYAGEHLTLRKRVAVKLLHETLATEPDLRRRFRAEAHVMAKIVHKHIVSVTDTGDDGGVPFFVMEYLAGEDLATTLEREGRLPWTRARDIGRQLCSALAATHAHKIVHRDLKPSNCFRVAGENDEDFIKVLDFGIAKVLDSTNRRNQANSLERIDSRHWRNTATGEVFGTMAYMAPEHAFEEPCDHRIDVYAVGVILYEMLTGQTPLATDHIGRFIDDLRFRVPSAPSLVASGAGIPADMDYLVLRALAKRPDERFASMTEFSAALAAASEDRVLVPLDFLDTADMPTTIWRPTEDAPPLPPVPRTSRRALVASFLFLVCLTLAQVTAILIRREPRTLDSEGPLQLAPPPSPPTPPETEKQVSKPALPPPPPQQDTNMRPSEPGGSKANKGQRAAQPWPVPLCGSLSLSERQVLLGPASATAKHCKHGYSSMPVLVNVNIADGRISGTPPFEYSSKHRRMALCIGRSLNKLVKLPNRLKACGLNFLHYF
jgi:serine/threonine protein kinase